jgi:zinc transporter, ZIP family
MTTEKIILLGAIAGFTIFLGLPLGRVRSVDPRYRAALSALATGILIFLLWDVLAGAVGPVEEGLEERAWGEFAVNAALLAGGFALGLMGLVYYDDWMAKRRRSHLVGPGAAAVDEFEGRSRFEALTPARRLAFLIAVGIGVHNFAEGLAIGQSAAAGDVALAVTLVVGFALHNATEGFGIVGPMGAEADVPSWRFLGLLGLIGGAPTFLGTVVGQAWVSEALSVAFLAVAGGSILYVIVQLFHVNRKFDFPKLVMWMVFAGLVLGFATDFVIEAAGV